jgi:hypothetical protein
VTATAVFSGTHLRPEVINTLHVRLALPDGLHVYAEPVPDGFFATTVSVKSSERIRVGRTVYPKTTPRHFATLGVALNVYEGVVDVQIPMALKANWESIPDVRARVGMPALNAVDLDITVNYQACSETVCYRPEKVSVALRVPTAELIYPTPAQ